MKIGLQPIAPKQIFDISKIKASIEDGLDQSAIVVHSQLEKNVATWKTRVKFYISKRDGEREIATTNDIYNYVTNGTRAHIITGKNGGNLAFYSQGFRSKTRPGRLGSTRGARATKGFRRTKSVFHPGTEARDFEGLTVKKWQKRIVTILEQSIKKAV